METTEMTTYSNILTVAKKEFLDKGYPKASLRHIAKNAGVTTGALYGYFKNKESLFDCLVEESYIGLKEFYMEILKKFFSLPTDEQMYHMEEYTVESAKDMLNYIYDHYDEFKLIICRSEGTKYANMIHELAQLDLDATHAFAKTTHQAGLDTQYVHRVLEHLLTSGMFTTFSEFIAHDISRDEALEMSVPLIAFYSAGWKRIMGF